MRVEAETVQNSENIDNHGYSKEVLQFFSKYKKYWDERLSVKYGKISLFWMKYVEMVHLYSMILAEAYTQATLIFMFQPSLKLQNFFFALN